MSDLTLAATPEDATALAAAEEHHAHLAGELSGRVAMLLTATDRDAAAADGIRRGLVAFCENELLPHAAAEEATLYAAAHRTTDGRLLVEGLIAEHGRLAALVDALREAEAPLTAAADARALQVLFEEHVAKENSLVLPLLAVTPGVDLAALLADLHHAFEKASPTAGTAAAAEPAAGGCGGGGGGCGGGCTCGAADEDVPELDVREAPHALRHAKASPAAGGGCGGGCTCGAADEDVPELDVREIPHALRHATVFGALDAVPVGRAMVLVAPHDPLPLLAQIEQRSRGHFAVEYLERGPAAWRLLLSHR